MPYYRGELVSIETIEKIYNKSSRLRFGLCLRNYGECHFCGTIEGEWACTLPPNFTDCPYKYPQSCTPTESKEVEVGE